MNHARRQQYRRVVRAGRLALTGVSAAILGLYLLAEGAAGPGAALLVLAVMLDDYDPLKVEPIRAIGAGTIVGIGSWGDYGPWFDYRLVAGQFAGKCIHVAEHIGSILAVGTSFNAGDTLATAYPGPDWTEWGWAKALDTPSVTWAECACIEQDNVNAGGRAFARFLRSLGAMTEQDPGPGPMYAGGSC